MIEQILRRSGILLRNRNAQPSGSPLQALPVPCPQRFRPVKEERLQLRRHLLEEGRRTVRSDHGPPQFGGIRPRGQCDLVLRPRNATPALHRHGQGLNPIGRHEHQAVPKGALLIVFSRVEHRAIGQGRTPPSNGRKGAEGQGHAGSGISEPTCTCGPSGCRTLHAGLRSSC